MTTDAKPIPVVRCRKCGKYYVIPTYLCTACHSTGTDLEETALSGNGRVATYTIIRIPPAGFEKQAPYTVAVIELDERLKVPARIANDPVSNDIKLFTPARFVERKDGIYWFQLATSR